MKKRAILVVDDDPSILSTLAEFLDMEGFSVQTASNGAEALESVEHSNPAVVLLDMRMPVMDGWSFVDALHGRGRQLPILVMTAAQDARKWAEEVGAAGYVAKPFDLMELLSALDRIVTPGGGAPNLCGA